MKNQKGKFIVLYGANNLGKSTQAKLLVEKLIISLGKNAEYLKYAVYNLEPSGPLINEYLRQGNPQQFTPREFQMLQVLNRTQNQPILREKINKGTWIVAEDYIGTGIAWGMVAGIDKELLYKLNSHLIREDLGILFQGEPFPEDLDKNNIHEANPAILEKANAAFAEIAQDFGWHIVNANQDIAVVQQQILDIINRKLVIIE
jgi:thymidylate kinase